MIYMKPVQWSRTSGGPKFQTVKIVVDMTLIRPLNEGQGHSFWYQSISHIRLCIGSQ